MAPLDVVRSIGSAVISENGRALENFATVNEDEFYGIPLEEFLYEAELQREKEKSPEYGEAAATVPLIELVRVNLLGKKPKNVSGSQVEEKKDLSDDKEATDLISESTATSAENANRMLRTASWGSVFYLITTDILGPTSAPYAISELGYVPGSLLYFLFGIAAAYTGYLLWQMFLTLDSMKYPLRNFGDVVGRIYGRRTRYFIDFFQFIQLLCNVAVIILGNGQGLSEIAKGKGCYTVLILVWALAGMIVGQIRSLAKFGFLANAAIWMNVFVIIATMACVSVQPPNYKTALTSNHVPYGPVETHVIVSGNGATAFSNQLDACMNIVYSYGGALVFIEFMSEMKRPWDFLKGMACAQTFIFVCYLIFGIVVYRYQGQFVINPANQGISDYGWQTATNVVNLISALIAAGLYGNVGIKVTYKAFFQRVLHFPSLQSKFGRLIWCAAVCVYWAIAFAIAAAIPNFSSLTSLVGAICILQFTYTFPAIMKFGLDMQIGAMSADGPYDPINKVTNRVDTWWNLSRWVRGYKTYWAQNTFNLIVFFAALSTAGLGIYSSIESLIQAFDSSITTSFTCTSTVA